LEKLYPLKEISEATSTSIPYWRKAIARKQLRVVRIGRAVRVSESELSRFLREVVSWPRPPEPAPRGRRGTH
jgi:excisionase family DNA binding protein